MSTSWAIATVGINLVKNKNISIMKEKKNTTRVGLINYERIDDIKKDVPL